MEDWINQVILWFHVVIMIFNASYAFLFKKSFYDYYFLLYSYLLLLHWTFLSGECFVTYIYKKIEDPTYIAGSILKNEWALKYPDASVWFENVIKVQNILSILVIYLVARRIRISPYVYVPYILIYEIYFYGIHFFDSRDSKEYKWFEKSIQYSLILGIILFLVNYRIPMANKRRYHFV